MGARWVVVMSLALGAGQAWTDDTDHYARCAACHLADGTGVPGMFPPLAGHVHRFFASPEGRSYLARVVLGGANGTVDVLGLHYEGVMPPVVADLSNAEVAALLNELVRRFGAAPVAGDLPFSPDDIAKARAAGSLTGVERDSLRRQVLQRRETKPDASYSALPGPAARQAPEDWMLHCQGCHGSRGALATTGMPKLAGRVAGHLGDPGGRGRLVRVPGVANASLSDARLAGLLNWMLATFDGEHLPNDFNAFTGEEVGALRQRPPTEGSAHASPSPPGHGIATHRDD